MNAAFEWPVTILIGSPRSGTTLLGHLFQAHPEVYYANEPRLVWRYGNDRRSDALQPWHATDAVRTHIRSTFAQRVERSGRSALVEKTPSNSLRVRFVDTVFPEARYVHIVRDGREAVAAIYDKWRTEGTGVSAANERERLRRRIGEATPRQFVHYLPELIGRLKDYSGPRLWGPRLPGMGQMVRDLPLLEVCALQWRWSVESVVRDSKELGDRLLTVRLEDMDADAVRAIHAHSGLSKEGLPEMLNEFNSRYDKSKVRGRFERLSVSEQEMIESAIEPTVRFIQGV